MKKIEQQMLNAIKLGINFKKSNTEVFINNGVIYVYLHKNLIAKINKHTAFLTNAGWATNITHSRLRAINNYLNNPVTIKGKQGKTLFINKDNDVIYNEIVI